MLVIRDGLQNAGKNSNSYILFIISYLKIFDIVISAQNANILSYICDVKAVIT